MISRVSGPPPAQGWASPRFQASLAKAPTASAAWKLAPDRSHATSGSSFTAICAARRHGFPRRLAWPGLMRRLCRLRLWLGRAGGQIRNPRDRGRLRGEGRRFDPLRALALADAREIADLGDDLRSARRQAGSPRGRGVGLRRLAGGDLRRFGGARRDAVGGLYVEALMRVKHDV